MLAGHRANQVSTHLGAGALVNHGRKHGPHVAEQAGSVDDEALPQHLWKEELVHVGPHLEQPDERLGYLWPQRGERQTSVSLVNVVPPCVRTKP